jgi:hypothetical protein
VAAPTTRRKGRGGEAPVNSRENDTRGGLSVRGRSATLQRILVSGRWSLAAGEWTIGFGWYEDDIMCA